MSRKKGEIGADFIATCTCRMYCQVVHISFFKTKQLALESNKKARKLKSLEIKKNALNARNTGKYETNTGHACFHEPITPVRLKIK